jgi:hypothetical protein
VKGLRPLPGTRVSSAASYRKAGRKCALYYVEDDTLMSLTAQLVDISKTGPKQPAIHSVVKTDIDAS